MKRAYADLHLCANMNDLPQLTGLIDKISMLGYSLVAIPSPAGLPDSQLRQVQKACEQRGLDFASRVDLKPRTPEELLKNLRQLRRRFEVIGVMCYSKAVARQAAKDRRVDLLNFPQPEFRRAFFDAAEAELASRCLACLEIDLKPVLILEDTARTKLLWNLRKEVQTARESHVPIVLSSGCSEELLLRRPKELVCLASLLDLHGAAATDTVSKNPLSVIRRNREKLSWRFVAPGIRVVRRGKDC